MIFAAGKTCILETPEGDLVITPCQDVEQGHEGMFEAIATVRLPSGDTHMRVAINPLGGVACLRRLN